MESPAAAVVRICGYPTNFALARAFVIFQTLSSQTEHAFLSILTFQDRHPRCLKITDDPVWNIDEEDHVLTRLSTVLKIIRDRECCEESALAARDEHEETQLDPDRVLHAEHSGKWESMLTDTKN